jgi:hypothetical protein
LLQKIFVEEGDILKLDGKEEVFLRRIETKKFLSLSVEVIQL